MYMFSRDRGFGIVVAISWNFNLCLVECTDAKLWVTRADCSFQCLLITLPAEFWERFQE